MSEVIRDVAAAVILDEAGRVAELSRMIGGARPTKAARAAAAELIAAARKRMPRVE